MTINEIYTDNPGSSAGMGENYLALDGLELNIVCATTSQSNSVTTLWDDYFDEDIASLANCSRAYQ